LPPFQRFDPHTATSQPRKFPGPLGRIFFYGHCRVLFILLHFRLLFSLLVHKQCGQFCFTCPRVSDSSPASVALSGYMVKCLANKMHKAEIGKSMPLLLTPQHLSRSLPGGTARPSRRQRPTRDVCPLGWMPAGPSSLCPCPSRNKSQPESGQMSPPSCRGGGQDGEKGIVPGSRAAAVPL
jgi:hypothetical protein